MRLSPTEQAAASAATGVESMTTLPSDPLIRSFRCLGVIACTYMGLTCH